MADPGSALWDEHVTPNRIAQLFPGTRAVFERYFINLLVEGSDCLDEVAWRHGMDSQALLRELQEAARTGSQGSRARARSAAFSMG